MNNRTEKIKYLKAVQSGKISISDNDTRLLSLDLSPTNIVNISTEDLIGIMKLTSGSKFNPETDLPHLTNDQIHEYLHRK